jgi:serine/threonine-protein kinase RsbW
MRDHLVVELRGDLAEIRRLAGLVDDFGVRNGVPAVAISQVNLALDELLTNTISYGFDDAGDHRINIAMSLDGDLLTVELVDDGKPFDPLGSTEPDIAQPVESRPVGGLGVFLVRKLMDRVDYRRVSGKNQVTLTKRASASGA